MSNYAETMSDLNGPRGIGGHDIVMDGVMSAVFGQDPELARGYLQSTSACDPAAPHSETAWFAAMAARGLLTEPQTARARKLPGFEPLFAAVIAIDPDDRLRR